MKRSLGIILLFVSGFSLFFGLIYLAASFFTAKTNVPIYLRHVSVNFGLAFLVTIVLGLYNYFTKSENRYCTKLKRYLNQSISMLIELIGFAVIGFAFWAMHYYNPILDRLSGFAYLSVFLCIPLGVAIVFLGRHIYSKFSIFAFNFNWLKPKKPKKVIDKVFASSSLNGSRRN